MHKQQAISSTTVFIHHTFLYGEGADPQGGEDIAIIT